MMAVVVFVLLLLDRVWWVPYGVGGPGVDPGQRCGWPRRRPRAAVWVALASTPGSGGCCYLL